MIRQATPADIDAIMSIVGQTIEGMRKENNPQWDEEYPAAQHFLADIAEGSLYVYDSAGVRGVVCANTDQPDEYAAVRWQQKGDAIVIHRMAVAPDARRQGVGTALVQHAESVAHNAGLRCLRTDTFSGNDNMQALFTRCGFAKRGEIQLRTIDRPFFCFDKVLEDA